MNPLARLFIALGALSACSSVALGAAASHALAERLAATQSWFQTALHYQQFHALGLIGAGLFLLASRTPSRWVMTSGWLMILGTLLFSGSLYLRSIAGIHDFRAATPFGGGAFMLAWLALAVGALIRKGEDHG